MKLDLKDILAATQGQALSKVTESFVGVGTDTRVSLKDQIFVALKGEAFDAHQFLPQAVSQGAAAVLVHQWGPEHKKLESLTTVVLVKDTLKALQDLARFERKKSKALVVGITGSNGKTTSKEFSAAVVSAKKKVHFSKGSFNNHWGVPLTLLAEPAGTEVLLAEMGMNHAGELTELCHIADPDVVVVTTVGRAHIEHFGSVEKIAEAKSEVYSAAREDAVRVYNLDNAFCRKMAEQDLMKFPKSRQVTFSSELTKADVYLHLEEISMKSLTVTGHILGTKGRAVVPVFGSQNLTNVMVAASVAAISGMSSEEVWKALPRCQTNWGRNQLIHTKNGSQILFDGYNANPDSMSALIQNVSLIKVDGKKVGVFGEMLELGEQSSEEHRNLGKLVGAAGFDCVWFYGPHFADFEAGIRSSGFSKKLVISNNYEESLASEVARVLSTDDIALVKGSRGMKLERFVLACDPIDFANK